MSAATTFDPLRTTDRFYTMVKSHSGFDKMEVRGVIETLLSTSGRERCLIGTYHRTTANIATLLEFKQPKHFQAIAMLARGLFELAVDIRLIDVIPDAPEVPPFSVAYPSGVGNSVRRKSLSSRRSDHEPKSQHPGRLPGQLPTSVVGR